MTIRVRESSNTKVHDERGRLVKDGFVDVNDAQEYAVNYLLDNDDEKKIIITQTIEIRKS